MPLTWYTSATFAQFPDETRASIQRTFASPYGPAGAGTGTGTGTSLASQRRQFCGYCGTPLTSWHERTRDDAEHICVTVGSLLDEDQAALADLGVLPGGGSGAGSDADDVYEYDDDGFEDRGRANADAGSALAARRPSQPPARLRAAGAPWFEELVHNTKLGRVKRQRGGYAGADSALEWEIVEWSEGDAPSAVPEKRKLGAVDAGDDHEMGGA